MELRDSKDWAILNDKLICVKREVSMQRGEIMWQNEDDAWEKVRGMTALKKRVGGRGRHAWGLASPGSGEARRKVHLQSQPCLSERANKSGGEEMMEKAVIQGLANPESGTCDGNLSPTSACGRSRTGEGLRGGGRGG